MKSILSLILYAFAVTALIFSSCKKLDLKTDVPDCIEKKIKQIKKDPVRNPPAEVWQWKSDGNNYYYITSACCDQYNYLYDDDCNQVCAPDGGFAGTGDGNYPDFSGLVEKVLVWKDDR